MKNYKPLSLTFHHFLVHKEHVQKRPVSRTALPQQCDFKNGQIIEQISKQLFESNTLTGASRPPDS